MLHSLLMSNIQSDGHERLRSTRLPQGERHSASSEDSKDELTVLYLTKGSGYGLPRSGQEAGRALYIGLRTDYSGHMQHKEWVKMPASR